MKNLSLILLICFGPILQDVNAASNTDAAAAQAYSNSVTGRINTATINLQSISEEINGLNLGSFWTKGILSQMENQLCGANVILDASGNVTSNGLSIDSTSGNYTNCNGGATGAYNTWSNSVTCWQNYIQGLTSNHDWKDAYDACSTDSFSDNICGNPCNDSSIATGGTDQPVAGNNFYYQIDCINNAVNANLYTPLTKIIGASAQPATATTPAVPATTGMLQNTIGLLGQMNIAFSNLFNYMNSNDPENTASQIITLSNNITNTLQPANTNSLTVYSNCYNNIFNIYGEELCSVNGKIAPCTKALQDWINDFNQLTTAYGQLINLLLDYQPYDKVIYGQATISSSSIKCILPDLCINNGINGDCTYSIPSISADFNTYIASITNSLNTISNLYDQYKPLIASTNVRLSAIDNQLKLLTKGITTVSDPNTGQIQAILAQCKADTANYVTELKNQEVIAEVFTDIIGTILGFALIELSGGLGIAMLPQLLMVLTMVPQINNVTIGLAANILGQDIANKIKPINN